MKRIIITFSIFIFLSIPSHGEISENDVESSLKFLIERSTKIEDMLPVLDLLIKYNFLEYVPSICPIYDDYHISSNYGWRTHPINKTKDFHTGIDMSCRKATFVHVTADGIVSYSGEKGGYGNCVIVRHLFGFETLYAHLSLVYRPLGFKVRQGHVIGFVGNTGISTGNHLHYEIKKNGKTINPMIIQSAKRR